MTFTDRTVKPATLTEYYPVSVTQTASLSGVAITPSSLYDSNLSTGVYAPVASLPAVIPAYRMVAYIDSELRVKVNLVTGAFTVITATGALGTNVYSKGAVRTFSSIEWATLAAHGVSAAAVLESWNRRDVGKPALGGYTATIEHQPTLAEPWITFYVSDFAGGATDQQWRFDVQFANAAGTSNEIVVDYGQNRTISKVGLGGGVITLGGATYDTSPMLAGSGTMQYSTDGAAWSTLLTPSSYDFVGLAQKYTVFTVSSTTLRYIKLRRDPGVIGCSELRIFA
jgi:hypothetical protein